MTRDEAADVIIGRVLEREGGIGQVPGEAWVTHFGQTPMWLTQFGFAPPRTLEDAAANYRTWLVRTRLIGVCDYPDSLADVVIDFAVQAGHMLAIAKLQRTLGVKVDGIIGPETQGSIDDCDRLAVGASLLGDKVRFRGELITGNPAKFSRYAHGWAIRDADQIRELGREGR